MDASECCLLLFSKPPRPGRVKTRLIGEYSARQASDLHAAFLEDLSNRLRRGRFELRFAWAVEPDESVPVTPELALRQEGRDLGERLFSALSVVAAEFRWIAAIGSDHPELSLSLVHQAFDKLAAGADVVIGPAADGGYYLLALASRALHAEVFREIPWSSEEVLETTLERCRSLEQAVHLLPTAPDVDTPEDVRRLIEELERDPEVDCPRTRQVLASWYHPQRSRGKGEVDENT